MRVIVTPLLAVAAGALGWWSLESGSPTPQNTAAVSAAPAPTSADTESSATRSRVPVLVPRIIARFPHDPTAFTQGLIWHDGALYESVGLSGRSDVRRVDLATGKVLARTPLPVAQFGEGLAAWKDTLVSLTWHDGIAHRWNARTLQPIDFATYDGEGWGLASDGKSLIRSDGSATLTFHDPETFAERRRLAVTLNGRPVTQLNELEWVDGAILANVWHTPYVLRIDPGNGAATALIDLRAVVSEAGVRDPESVANGIAWDAKRRRLFVTGKRWPTLFEIALPEG